MHRVVMLEPQWKLTHHRDRIWPRIYPRIVPLESLPERLGHAVGLRTFDRRGSRHEANLSRQLSRFRGDVRRAVVRQPFDCRWQAIHRPAAALHAVDHEVAYVPPLKAASG